MDQDLIKLPFKHSKGLEIGIEVLELEDIYNRQPLLDHKITDPFRIKEGKIVEHWDTIESIPPRDKWKNGNGNRTAKGNDPAAFFDLVEPLEPNVLPSGLTPAAFKISAKL